VKLESWKATPRQERARRLECLEGRRRSCKKVIKLEGLKARML